MHMHWVGMHMHWVGRSSSRWAGLEIVWPQRAVSFPLGVGVTGAFCVAIFLALRCLCFLLFFYAGCFMLGFGLSMFHDVSGFALLALQHNLGLLSCPELSLLPLFSHTCFSSLYVLRKGLTQTFGFWLVDRAPSCKIDQIEMDWWRMRVARVIDGQIDELELQSWTHKKPENSSTSSWPR